MIRTVVMPATNQLLISLPDNYIGKQVEVIAFTLDDAETAKQKGARPVTFTSLRLDTSAYTFNRDEANER